MDEKGVIIKMVDEGKYIVIRAYSMYFLFPATLAMHIWIGRYELTLSGHGAVRMVYDEATWEPGLWTRSWWWLPVTPFVLIPRCANGIFYLYGKETYWEICADSSKAVVGYEVKEDWSTRTGKFLQECTWDSVKEIGQQ